MSGVQGFLERLVAALTKADVAYMVAGSYASTFHGTPRTTQDIDLVIDPNGHTLATLLAEFPEDRYYVSIDAANEALRRRGQFNVIDFDSGWKSDLIIRKQRPFSEVEFARRRRGTLVGTEVFIASAEDTVLSKLEWARSGASERQIRDVQGVLSVQGDNLDLDYIEHWVAALGVQEQWQAALG